MLDPLVNPSVPIAGAVAFLGLALLVARRTRHRRRLARLAREQEESRVNISRGNLAATALPDLMRTIAEYRASGMLELTAPAESFALYFLFGRIFHAVGPALEGEAALGRALRLTDAGYRFDSKVRLPREVTISTGTHEPVPSEAHRSR
ncbi:MAG TPA: DUF4388 domain-containing protein [Candidatus Dormibacteraeota bacterium]|jgi:hypothetical protein